MSEFRVVTRAEAIERFLQERVLGDRGFSIKHYMCLYAGPNGGCEIGQYLPRDVAERADRESWSLVQIQTVMTSGAEKVIFEGLGDGELQTAWWTALQRAHDRLARYTTDSRYPMKLEWEGFQDAMQDLVEIEASILEGEDGSYEEKS